MRAVILILFAAGCLLLGSLGIVNTQHEVSSTGEGEQMDRRRVVLVVHGGAGVLNDEDLKQARLTKEQHRKRVEDALTNALEAGYRSWGQDKTTAVDAVEATIRALEDSGVFNAGRGAAFNHDGRIELDAAIMEGRMNVKKEEEKAGRADVRKRAGAVAGVSHIKNPISAARAVMEMEEQQHVMLVGEGAEWFALREDIRNKYAIEVVSNVYFWTDRRLQQIRKLVDEEESGHRKSAQSNSANDKLPRYRPDTRFGTVGAVAVKRGSLAAGTSTGGLPNKLKGRVGDSPIIGAGIYADDRACAISCTGTGEIFIRHVVAHDVVARMLYKQVSVKQAAGETIAQLPDEKDGIGGLVALDKDGHYAYAMSSRLFGMYRGYVTEKGDIYVAIYAGDQDKRMTGVRRGK
jgi:beta-aspartyl-peptidase (threonine type)